MPGDVSGVRRQVGHPRHAGMVPNAPLSILTR